MQGVISHLVTGMPVSDLDALLERLTGVGADAEPGEMHPYGVRHVMVPYLDVGVRAFAELPHQAA